MVVAAVMVVVAAVVVVVAVSWWGMEEGVNELTNELNCVYKT